MDYTAAADKFERESDILVQSLEAVPVPSRKGDVPTYIRAVELALAQAKRVRTASTVLVRELARERDELQP